MGSLIPDIANGEEFQRIDLYMQSSLDEATSELAETKDGLVHFVHALILQMLYRF